MVKESGDQPNLFSEENVSISDAPDAGGHPAPDFFINNPKLAEAWDKGDIRRASDLVVPEVVVIASPRYGSRGLGSRMLAGLVRLDAGETVEPVAATDHTSETVDEKVIRLQADAAIKDAAIAPTDWDVAKEVRRLSGVYFEDQGGIGTRAFLERTPTRDTVEKKTRPTSKVQNSNEASERKKHNRRAGRYQR